MSWSVEKSAALYGINAWGGGYFKINQACNIEVTALKDKPGLVLPRLIKHLSKRGGPPPILLRFPDIVRTRVELISHCFANAIRENGYKGSYAGVYPIKVNQQRHLLEEIVDFGKENRLGL